MYSRPMMPPMPLIQPTQSQCAGVAQPRANRLARPGRVLLLALGVLGGGTALGCRDLAGNQALPSGTQNPAFYHTPAGALSMRNAAIAALEQALVGYITNTGELTDELESRLVNTNPGVLAGSSLPLGGSLDERILPELRSGTGTTADRTYAQLQRVRGSVNQALGALAAYDTAAPRAMFGELYALEGYAELLLAEFYCSGIPLSTLDFNNDYTYHPSSTTVQVYQDALHKLDSAMVLAADSARILNLARVLRGRAWLDLGQYDSAAAAVSSVPDGFQYTLEFQSIGGTCPNGTSVCHFIVSAGDTVSDGEGINGLPFVSSGDPRTADTVSTGSQKFRIPRKYASLLRGTGFSPFTVGDAVEARLIQAEAALHTGDVTTWLALLNQLRTVGIVTLPADTLADTLGVTGCGPDFAHVCGDDGVTGGYFQVPAGYSFSFADTVTPAPADVQSYCTNYSSYYTCWFGTMVVNVYGRPARTFFGAGTGGVEGLAPLTDPGSSPGDSARVSLLFQERAYWLYLTGHRQGDLRRLTSPAQYGRTEDQVYPTGPYTAPGAGVYGSDVTAPIPSSQYVNPLYHGCLSRD